MAGCILYFDVTFGASGDMMLAAFMDLGMPLEYLLSVLRQLPLPEFSIETRRVLKNGISALRLEITTPDEKSHRSLREIKGMISSSSLESDIKELGIRIFQALAEAEAKVHGQAADDVTFHEVGALDSIIDIVGITAAVSYFGVESAFHSMIPLCGGAVEAAHGKLPAMSPAASILLKGRRFYMSDTEGELITPTAAAVLSVLAPDVKNAGGGGFSYDSIGTGAGSRDYGGHPNIMRIFKGEFSTGGARAVTVIETNIDDMNPQLVGYLFEKLLSLPGVLDVFVAPVTMKKNRPGFLLKVLSEKRCFDEVADMIFRNTTTIGLRFYDVDRLELTREVEKIQTKFGEFSVKVSKMKGRIMNASCEYEECRAAAKKSGSSVRDIMNHVNAVIQRTYFDGK